MVKAGNVSKRQERGTLVGNVETGGSSRDYRGGGNYCVDDTYGGCEHKGNENMGSVAMGNKGCGDDSKEGKNGDKGKESKGNVGSNDSS